MNNLRRIKNLAFLKEDLYLIVEGETDELFIEKILSFFPHKYNIIIRVANGNGNIPIQYNILNKVYNYNKICVLYDLDGRLDINDLKRFLENRDVRIKDEFIFFTNPCIEYLILLTKTHSKKKYLIKKDFRDDFNKYFNIRDFRGRVIQVKKIITNIDQNDYQTFRKNIILVSDKFEDLPSSNFNLFLKLIEQE